MSAVQTTTASLSRAQIEEEIRSLSDGQWAKAERIAVSLCAGITGIEPEDLLQEAMTKFLEGVRVWPAGVPALVVLENVMFSIASNARRRVNDGPIDVTVELDPVSEERDEPGAGRTAFSTTAVTPEDEVCARQQMAAVYASLAGDRDLQDLTAAWAMGMRGEECWTELGWTPLKYDAERKRLIRRLDKLARETE